jgi:hypothetical protein
MALGTAHVVLDYETQPPRFLCEKCGDFQVVHLPLEVSALVKASKRFVDDHEDCGTVETEIGSEG